MKTRFGFKALVARIAIAGLAGLFGLVALEGVSSLCLVLADMRQRGAASTRPHTEYDPVLG